MSGRQPFTLETARLRLDQPTASDVDRIVEACRDAVFERFMTTPWPYEREHAVGFVDEYAPSGWASGLELTWALRRRDDAAAPLLGVIGLRSISSTSADVGYWLHPDARGNGFMPEAVTAVLDWADTDPEWVGVTIGWEAVVGNTASLRVAQKVGFAYTGVAAARAARADWTDVQAWTAVAPRHRDAETKGWPA